MGIIIENTGNIFFLMHALFQYTEELQSKCAYIDSRNLMCMYTTVFQTTTILLFSSQY